MTSFRRAPGNRWLGYRELGYIALAFAAAVFSLGTLAQEIDSLPLYQPSEQVSGTIRLWGHGSFKKDFMGKLVKAWIEGFNKYQPDVKVDNKMYGTASAIGALYAGAGDLSILGEEISPPAARAFQRVKHYPPYIIQIATGSLDVEFYDYAHMVFVNKDNPLSQLTLAQLDAVFGAEHRRGLHNLRNWGELGLSGEWADKRIQPYTWRDEDFTQLTQEVVLLGSHRWNNDLKDFVHINRPDGTIYEHSRQILDALAHDRYGIAISNVHFTNPQVKLVALAAKEGGPYFLPTKENLISQNYPLTRIIPAVLDRKPGRPIDPKVREFLRFILSREGQQDIVRETGYLPLGTQAIQEQLKKLQ